MVINNVKYNFKPLISKAQINSHVKRVADHLNSKYSSDTKIPTFIVTMNGAAMFAHDVFCKLKFDFEVRYCKYKSYNGTGRGDLIEEIPITFPVGDEYGDIIIIEDLIDTGQTLLGVLDKIKSATDNNIYILPLLVKVRKAPDLSDLYIYKPIEIDDLFVIGYGMDIDEYLRSIKSIYYVTDIHKI